MLQKWDSSQNFITYSATRIRSCFRYYWNWKYSYCTMIFLSMLWSWVY